MSNTQPLLPDSVTAMITDYHAPTAPLAEFIQAYTQDENLWWRISCGHHQNLLEAALDAMTDLGQQVVEAGE